MGIGMVVCNGHWVMTIIRQITSRDQDDRDGRNEVDDGVTQ